MRFGILSQWYPPEPGPAAVPGVLARALAQRGHEVQVVTGFPNYPTGTLADGYRLSWRRDETVDGVHVRRVALYPSHDRSIGRRFLNAASFAADASLVGVPTLRHMDAVWVYNSPATIGLPSALVSASGGPPHLMHIMDLWPDSIFYSGLANGKTIRMGERAIGRWCSWTYRRSAAIACISARVIDELEARGVPRSKMHHIPVWTDEDVYFPRDRDERLAEELGVGDDFTLLYAGSLGNAQGLDALLDTCALLGDIPDFKCIIAGSGVDEDRLRARALSLGLDNTTFLGRWPGADMGRLMSVGDLHLVSLSADRLSTMTMPSKLPATLASGRPIVAMAVGEPADIIERAGAGWTVAPGDVQGLEHAVRSAHRLRRSELRSLGEAGRNYYQRRLSMSNGVDAVERLLGEIANAPRVPGADRKQV